MFRHLCLLYSSCEALAESGEDCRTGTKDCTVCSFEDTVDGQCGKKNKNHEIEKKAPAMQLASQNISI